MPIPRAISMAQEKELCALYKEGATVKEFQDMYGTSYNTIVKYLKSNRVWGGNKAPILEHYKLCPKCEAHNDPDARYCSRCGFHYKTEEELLAARLKGFIPEAKHFPANVKDEFVQSILAAAKILENLSAPK